MPPSALNDVLVVQGAGCNVALSTFLAASYSHVCVIGSFSAEGRTSQALLDTEEKRIIAAAYKDVCCKDYVLGPLDNNARCFDVELTQLETGPRASWHMRTKVYRQNENTFGYKQELSPDQVKAIMGTRNMRTVISEALPLSACSWQTNYDKVLTMLSHMRSKYGLFTNSEKLMSLLQLPEIVDLAAHQGIAYEHKGEPHKEHDDLGHIINAMVSMGETVAFGLPGITKKSVAYNRRFSEAADAESAQIVEKMRYDPHGIRVKPSVVRTFSAWAWVAASFIFAVSVGAFNLTGKENWLERVLDSIAVITFMLISVFGLIKLKSEDEHAIRNVLLGYRIVKKPNELIKYYDSKPGMRQRSIYQAIVASEESLGWLSSTRACYARKKPTGNFILTGSLSVQEAWQTGLIVNEVISFDFVTNRNFMIELTADSEYHKGGDSGFLRMYAFHEFSINNEMGIAGKRCMMESIQSLEC